MTIEDQIIDTWKIQNRINLYLLDSLQSEALSSVPASKGRNVGEVFAHLHNVRLMWLKTSAPELLDGLQKIEREAAGDSALLRSSLEASSSAIEKFLIGGLQSGHIRGFKPHPTAFLGYIISHESHHRGQIMLALKQSGHAAEKTVGYGIWEWGSR